MLSKDATQPSKPASSRPIKWLITGGCGFIGTNLVKNLLDEGGHIIRIIDNLSVGSREDLSRVCEFSEIALDCREPQHDSRTLNTAAETSCELIVGDVMDKDLALRATRGTDVIVHLAANTGVELSVKDPAKDCYTNVIGTFNYLEAARSNRVSRFIFASSGAPVGECEPPIHEEIAPHPVSPYGASKLAGEAYCSAYYRTFGVETVALRFGNVYGPGSGHKSSVVAKFIRQSIHGGVLQIYGDGGQTRDFIFVDDLLRAIRLAAGASDAAGQVFQIATNRETAVRELTDLLLSVMTRFGYPGVKVLYTEPRIGDVRRNFSDTTKARVLLGWQSEIGLAEGLERTVAWFLNRPDSEQR
jgi:UDP-glucose 4-epimerase